MNLYECTCEIPSTDLKGNCLKCGGVVDMPTSDTQLPAEFQKELDDLVMKHTLKLRNDNDYQIGYEKGIEKGIEIGATAYQAQREIEELKQTIELHLKSLSIRNEYVVKAMALLEKVIYRHEGGLLPDRLLYNEIKTFLDGTK